MLRDYLTEEHLPKTQAALSTATVVWLPSSELFPDPEHRRCLVEGVSTKGLSKGGVCHQNDIWPGTADFVNKLEVAFNLPNRNCAKATAETQSGCEEEGSGAVGVLLSTAQVLPQAGSVDSELAQPLKRESLKMRDPGKKKKRQLLLQSGDRNTEIRILYWQGWRPWYWRHKWYCSEKAKTRVPMQCNCMRFAARQSL